MPSYIAEKESENVLVPPDDKSLQTVRTKLESLHEMNEIKMVLIFLEINFVHFKVHSNDKMLFIREIFF